MRPRIKVQRAYTPNRSYGKDDASFRPEGFGAGLQPQGTGRTTFRPRYGADRQGGYQPRQNQQYDRPRQGGYRPRYNAEGDDSHQPHQNQQYDRPRQGGYRPARAMTAISRARISSMAAPVSSRAATAPATTPVRATPARAAPATGSSSGRDISAAAGISAAATGNSPGRDTGVRADTVSARPAMTPTPNTV